MSLIILHRATGKVLGACADIRGLRPEGPPVLIGRAAKASLGLHVPGEPPTDGQGQTVDHFAVWPDVVTFRNFVIEVGAIEQEGDAENLPGFASVSAATPAAASTTQDPRVAELTQQVAELTAWRDQMLSELERVRAEPVPHPEIKPLTNAGPSVPQAPASAQAATAPEAAAPVAPEAVAVSSAPAAA